MPLMLSHYRRRCLISRTLLLCLFVAFLASTVLAKGELSVKQARKLIATMPGFNLKTGSVRVAGVRPLDADTTQATAEIATAFRFEKNQSGQWRVAEFRTGQEYWQSVAAITRALKMDQSSSSCDNTESMGIKAATNLSSRRARCLLAELLGLRLPSDAVRIKSISPMSLPFGSRDSALVEALIAAEFQFTKANKGAWRVAAVRTGTREWVDPEHVFNEVNAENVSVARTELDIIAKALEEFRRHRGFYVESKKEAVLIDFLSPRYLTRVIRLDPWRRPYVYEGTRNSFSLRSLGPDGKENTPDDIILTGNS
jgi:hypothetical protein